MVARLKMEALPVLVSVSLGEILGFEWANFGVMCFSRCWTSFLTCLAWCFALVFASDIFSLSTIFTI